MNVRLSRDFVIPAATIFQDEFHINIYNISIDFITVSDVASDHNIAYERINHWLYNVFADSVMVINGNPHCKALSTVTRVIELPDEPVDQIVNMMLFAKLNAITENRMRITDIELSSNLGDQVRYLHCEEETTGPFDDNGWWCDPRPNCGDAKGHKGKKVVSMLDRPNDPTWRDLGLGWADEDHVDAERKVMFVFNKDEPK